MCTALSLFKVIIHTSLGASIHSFRDYHVDNRSGDDSDDNGANAIAQLWTMLGIFLCIAIFVYLSIVARRAVDEELEEDECVQVPSAASAVSLGRPTRDDDLEANIRH